MHRFSIVFLACSLLSLFACAQAPQGKTGPSTDVKKNVSDDVDHSAFDALLKQVVKGDRVDYAGLVGDQRLVKYIETIAATNPETLPSDDARLAFYINAYNALTLQSVLTHWPTITSVSTIKPDFAFFKEEVHTIGGKKVSLDAIENKIIRPTFKEPRIHAALNCASISCPPLANYAFTAKGLDAQLNQVFTAFANDAARNAVNTESGTVQLTNLNWYKVDFRQRRAKYLSRFVSDPARKATCRHPSP